MKSQEVNKAFWISIAIKFALLMVLFAVSIILTAFTVDINKVKTAEFWIQVGVNYGFVIISFNVVRGMSIDSNKKTNKAYRFVVRQFSRMVDFILGKKLEKKVDDMVEKENEDRKYKAEKKALRKITSVFSIEEIRQLPSPMLQPENFTTKELVVEDKKTAEELFLEKVRLFKLTKREVKQLRKIIKRIINGKIKYAELNTNDLLLDNETESDYNNIIEVRIKSSKLALSENIKKTFSWFLFAVVLALIEKQTIDTSLWELFLTKATLILGSAVSGLASGTSYINYRKNILNNRVTLLNRLDEVEFTVESDAKVD